MNYFNYFELDDDKRADEVEKTIASRRDLIALIASLVILTVFFLILIECGAALGFALIWLAAVSASIWYLKDAAVKEHSFTSMLYLTASVAFTPLYVLNLSGLLAVTVFFVQTLSWLVWMATVTGHGIGHRYMTDLLTVLRILPGASFHGIFDLSAGLREYRAVCKSEKVAKAKKKRSFPWGIIGGAALALPVLMILLPILASADEAFDQMIGGIFDRLIDFVFDLANRLGSLLTAFVLALIFFFPVTGIMYRFRKTKGSAVSLPKELFPGTTLLGFYGSIALLCFAYLFSQLSYLFNGFMGILPHGMTAANYARRGFFEIFAISLILLVLIGIGLLYAKKDRLGMVISGLIIFLCTFNLVLIATASAKMLLYMRLYGLTVKRLTVSAILLFLAVLFAVLILGRIFKSFPSLPVVLASAIIIFGVIGYANPAQLVADYNVAAWESGRLETVDLEHLRSLDGSAIDALISVSESSDPALASEAEKMLCDLYSSKCAETGTIEGTRLPIDSGLFDYHFARLNENRKLNDFFGYTE